MKYPAIVISILPGIAHIANASSLSGTMTAATPDIPKMSDNSSIPIQSRFPPGEESDSKKAALEDAEKRVAEVFGSSFKLKDDQGNLLGPFGILSYTPETFLLYLQHMQAINTLPYLTIRERELAALATAHVTQAAFITYAHKRIGMGAGLSQEQVDDAAEGKRPAGLEERESVVYDAALSIAKSSGKLDDWAFEAAREKIGREGVSALAQVVGAFLLGSMLINVADIPVPAS